MEVQVTDATFDQEVLKSTTPVLVDFWAPWCGPCKMQNPILEEVAKDFEGKAKIAKVNVDENPGIAQKFLVMSIPTLMLFKNGEVIKQMIGVQMKETLTEELNNLIK